MITVLNILNRELASLGIPYEFMQWTAPVTYPYFVGEYSEFATETEDGFKETSFILTGTTKGSWLELEQMKAKIEGHFPAAGGLRSLTPTGTVTVFYENSFPVRTGEADLKRIQINLRVKEWRTI